MSTINSFLAQHLHSIAIAIIATLLVLFGGDLNRLIKRLLGNCHLVIRLALFVLVCIFLYGLGSIFLAKVTTHLLASISRGYLALSLLAIFLVLGLIANARKQM